MGDAIGDVMSCLSFDITDIDDHLEVVSCDVIHFAGSCREGLRHDATFRTDDLDPPLPIDLNILGYVCTNEGILSDHAKFLAKLDEELGNENELDDVNHANVNEDTHHGNTYRDFEYDVDSSEDKRAKDDADVMTDEENEIHEGEVEVHYLVLARVIINSPT
ncbi:hypothetical protein Tco_1330751 [Tanacetum coccineum]